VDVSEEGVRSQVSGQRCGQGGQGQDGEVDEEMGEEAR